MPKSIIPPASEYVGMHKHIPIHKLAKRDARHECSRGVHGRRSSFQRSVFAAASRAASGVIVTIPSRSTCVFMR